MFARNRCLIPGTEQYNRYYEMHPEHKEYDDRRRASGGPLGKPGSIDASYRPNVSMLISSFELPNMLGHKARVIPGSAASQSTYANKRESPPPAQIEPAKATRIVKGWAKHLGADLVGICRIDPRWAYSHRGEIHYGEWDEWGMEIPEPLPYAVVVATADGPRFGGHCTPYPFCGTRAAIITSRGPILPLSSPQWLGHHGLQGCCRA